MTSSASAQARESRAARDWSRIGLWLVAATLVYNVAEGVIALSAGAIAESIALFGFGLDSLIEVAAAGALLWRLAVEARGREGEALERTERAVHRFIGATFIALALYVTVQETLACSYLSFALLLGLVANATVGWWWAEPMAALLMVPWLVREGREGQEGLRGESCAESCG